MKRETAAEKQMRQDLEENAAHTLYSNAEDTLRERHGLNAIRDMHAAGQCEYEALLKAEVIDQLPTIAEMYQVCPDNLRGQFEALYWAL